MKGALSIMSNTSKLFRAARESGSTWTPVRLHLALVRSSATAQCEITLLLVCLGWGVSMAWQYAIASTLPIYQMIETLGQSLQVSLGGLLTALVLTMGLLTFNHALRVVGVLLATAYISLGLTCFVVVTGLSPGTTTHVAVLAMAFLTLWRLGQK